MPQPQGGGGRSGVSGFARGRLGLGEFVAEQVTEGNAAAVGVAGDVDGVVHRGDVAHDVAEHVEALDDLAVLIQALEVIVALQATADGEQRRTDLQGVEGALLHGREEYGLLVVVGCPRPPRTCRCSGPPWP